MDELTWTPDTFREETMNEENTIKFKAIVAKVQTLADGGLRVTLDLPEQAVMQAAQLMEVKRVGMVIEVAIAEDKEKAV